VGFLPITDRLITCAVIGHLTTPNGINIRPFGYLFRWGFSGIKVSHACEYVHFTIDPKNLLPAFLNADSKEKNSMVMQNLPAIMNLLS
jgi:hypothetical protein